MTQKKPLARSERQALAYGLANRPVGDHLADILDGVGDLRIADTLITSAQLLALAAAPQQVVAAPGAGKYLEFVYAVVFLDYGGTAYAADAGEDFAIRYTDGSGQIVSEFIDGEELEAVADTAWILRPLKTGVTTAELALPMTANAALVADNIGGGEWITGNSPLKVRVGYRIHDSAQLIAIGT